jgi:hypothetical protein
MELAITNFLWDFAILILVTPLAGWTLMKLAEELEKAKHSKNKVKLWLAYSAIAFVILFFLKFPMHSLSFRS